MPKTEELRRTIEKITTEGETVAFGVAVHDYETEFAFAINPDRRFHAASTIKVAVLLAVLRAADEGRLQLDDPLHVRNRFLSAVDGTAFHLARDGDGETELYRTI